MPNPQGHNQYTEHGLALHRAEFYTNEAGLRDHLRVSHRVAKEKLGSTHTANLTAHGVIFHPIKRTEAQVNEDVATYRSRLITEAGSAPGHSFRGNQHTHVAGEYRAAGKTAELYGHLGSVHGMHPRQLAGQSHGFMEATHDAQHKTTTGTVYKITGADKKETFVYRGNYAGEGGNIGRDKPVGGRGGRVPR